ncbi:serine/threonine-protein kinase [Chondromyces apiculatus]|uniref:non-specific serine/threonine protein kinase n=1 Tax=Chondromyces apiculatus DSM 436 TaxID=1192034 RepID=A0A017ST43_9BACT|nr:serine/threonine-protein kinase [Chondromyces apiculatus]EYF00158.1 Hypothetical protein CAP_1119 [Chondromyces apiculatus DSM 436]
MHGPYDPSLIPGALLAGKYRLLHPVARGGMGSVWAARHERMNREVALKLLLQPDPDLRARLLQEAEICGKVQHPNVISLYTAELTERGDPFLVMELLHGETLAALLKRKRRLDAPDAARIARDIARGLSAAHRLQVIHRDLKPSNVFLCAEEQTAQPTVKLLDFGISKYAAGNQVHKTATGVVLGSIAYMSPEQIRSDPLDPRTDLWSFGVVLFEMLAGARPFQGPDHDILAAILTRTPPDLTQLVRGIDPGFAALVKACLQRDRSLRPPSASELAARLDAFTSLDAVPPSVARAPSPSLPDHPSSGGISAPGPPPSRDPTAPPTPPHGFAGAPLSQSPASVPRRPSGATPPHVTPFPGAPPSILRPGLPPDHLPARVSDAPLEHGALPAHPQNPAHAPASPASQPRPSSASLQPADPRNPRLTRTSQPSPTAPRTPGSASTPTAASRRHARSLVLVAVVALILTLVVAVAISLAFTRRQPAPPQSPPKADKPTAAAPPAQRTAAPLGTPDDTALPRIPSTASPEDTTPAHEVVETDTESSMTDAGKPDSGVRKVPLRPQDTGERELFPQMEASAKASAASAQAPDPPFDKAAAQSVLRSLAAQAPNCNRTNLPHGTGTALVAFDRSGVVLSVALNLSGSAGAQEIATCISSTFRLAKVAPFSGALPSVSQSFRY